jgi:hypothetical protein
MIEAPPHPDPLPHFVAEREKALPGLRCYSSYTFAIQPLLAGAGANLSKIIEKYCKGGKK